MPMPISPEQRAAIRMRYIARHQLDSLSLHDDLCLKVLNDYGCNVVEIEPTTETKQGLIELAWPEPTATRCRYIGTLLAYLTQRVLLLTEQDDAKQAAYALS